MNLGSTSFLPPPGLPIAAYTSETLKKFVRKQSKKHNETIKLTNIDEIFPTQVFAAVVHSS